MTNEQIIRKCEEKKDEIMEEINSTPKGWKLWLYIEDDEISWTTVTESTYYAGYGELFSTWYYQAEEKNWNEIKTTLWRDLYNSRGDN